MCFRLKIDHENAGEAGEVSERVNGFDVRLS